MSALKMANVKMSRKTKIIIGVVITVALLCGVVIGLFLAWRNMFRQNDRFLVLRVNVTSAEGQGKWHGKVKEVMPIVVNAKKNVNDHNNRGDTENRIPEKKVNQKELLNLFDLDLKVLREKLEEVPEIEKVEIRRVLPDTLDIQITERVPVAFIERVNGKLLIDREGVVIRRSHAIDISGVIPVIVTHKKEMPAPGEVFEEVKPVLEFIQLTKKVSDYSSLRIMQMELLKDDFITIRIHFGGDADDWYLIKNVPTDNPSEGMDRILSGIELAKKERRREIDLRFAKQAVLTTTTGDWE